jgi:putative membrane protein
MDSARDVVRMRAVAGGALFFSASAAQAHAGLADYAWNFEPWLVVLLLSAAWGYARGVSAVWHSAGRGRGVDTYMAAAFGAGWAVLALSLVSPLDSLGATLFSAHMVQHELLMLVAAPLLVLGRPLAMWSWALPLAWRQRAGRVTRARAFAGTWEALTRPLSAWSVHALALWVWHVPAFFGAALRSEGIHVLQHSSFLFSAVLFWWALFGLRRASATHPSALVYLFTTMLHTGALGALLVFSSTAWYQSTGVTLPWHLTPVEDQQLGGLIMWIPGGTVYVIAALVIMARWLNGGAYLREELRA